VCTFHPLGGKALSSAGDQPLIMKASMHTPLPVPLPLSMLRLLGTGWSGLGTIAHTPVLAAFSVTAFNGIQSCT
jgi:hypothetical protein